MGASMQSASTEIQRFLSVIDTKRKTTISQSYVDKVYSAVDVLQISRNVTLTENLVFPKGKTLKFINDGALVMQNTSVVINGTIEAPRKHIFKYNGALSDARVTGSPETEEFLCDWFGVIPDGVTNHVATGRMFALPSFASKTGCTVVFTKGLFKCGIDNNQSNVTFRGESGNIFAGVIHAAINNTGVADQHLNPKNVKWVGKFTSLTRFGTYHCDGVDVDEVYIKDDPENSELGFAGGVHLYKDTKNFTCRKMTIEASKRNFGFGLDSDDQLLPEGCHIGHLEIITTDVLGVFLRAKNSRIDSINIRSWGKGNAVGDDDLSLGLPGEIDAAIVQKVYAFYALGCSGMSIGTLTIDGKDYGDLAEQAVLLGDGTCTIDSLTVRNSPKEGIKQLAGDYVINTIDSRLSAKAGINQVGGSLSGISLISDFNGEQGYLGNKNLIDLNVTYKKIRTNNNVGAGVNATAVNFNVDEWESAANGADVYNVSLTSPSGRVAKIKTQSQVNSGGGVLINGGASAFEYSVKSVNEGSATKYAVYINGGAKRRCTDMDIVDSSNQALRVVNLSNSSFDQLSIDTGFGDGIIGAGLSNVSFSNSVNKLSTNLVLGSVAEFNNSGITQ